MDECSLKTDDKKLLKTFHLRLYQLCKMLLLQSEYTAPNVSYHCLKCLCTTLHFVGSLSFCSQEADGCPSPPQIFPRTKCQLIPQDFVFPEVYHLPFNATCIQHYNPFLLSMCKISTEQKVITYVLVRNISSKQKFA